MEQLIHQKRLNSLKIMSSILDSYSEFRTDPEIFARILEILGVEFEMLSPNLDWPPKGSPLLLVSNHPMGGIEGIVLAALALSRRPDTRLMYSSLLMQIEGVGDMLLPISTKGDSATRVLNRNSIREAFKHLSSGGCLAMFPGGGVDTRIPHNSGRAHESNWSPHAADLAKKTGAVVIPIRFGVRLANPLPWMGRIKSRLNNLKGVSLKRPKPKGGCVQLAVGSPIPNSVLRSFTDRQVSTDFLQLVTRVCGEHYGLLPKKLEIFTGARDRKPVKGDVKKPVPLVTPIDPLLISAELSALPPEACIQAESNYFMYLVRATDIPITRKELGRLREYTFRSIGEGTGKSFDWDEFDESYHHLIVWDRSQSRLVGAYRMSINDSPRNSYVDTLFQISGPLLRQLNNALELGRSFITPDYQVESGILNLMWKGIGRYVSQNAIQPILYGPVSMSAQFHPVSRALILHYLRQKHYDAQNARHVRAPFPPKFPNKLLGIDLEAMARGIRSVDHLSALVSVIEKDGKGLPPLIKHYTRLGGRFLAFGVDDQFGNAVDGLLTLDLRDTPFALLKRFMGETAARTFLEQHK